MRSDMGKCVIERPRSGSSNPSAKARWYGKITQDDEGYDYDGMTKLPSSRKQEAYHPKIGEKNFTDVLGPIEGYLRSSVGRPWDDVYSELCVGLGRFSWPMRHVLAFHVNVAINTWEGADGHIWFDDKYGPHKVDGGYRSEFYVHPRSKTLQYKKQERFKYRPKKEGESVKLADSRHMVKINGLWFIGRYKDMEYPEHRRYCSGCEACKWPNTRTQTFVTEKSASRKEIRRALS